MDRTEEAQRKVVAAADRLFCTRGVQAVGMDAVRGEAGVSLKRMYQCFGSKDDLVIAVLEHRSALWADGVAGATTAAAEPRDKILAIFDFLDSWFREPDFRGCAFINMYGELGPTSPRVAAAVRKQKAGFAGYVAELVERADLPAWLAPQITLLAEGAQTAASISGSADPARQAQDAVRALFQSAEQDQFAR